LIGVGLATALALPACSSGAPRPVSAGRTPQTSPGTTTTRPGATGSPTGAPLKPYATGSPTSSIYPSATPTLPDHADGTLKAPLEIQIGHECVQPGGTQTITIRSTPLYQVSWATMYPDGSAHEEWKGWEISRTGPDGMYTHAFVIPPQAPLGRIRNDVAALGETNGKRYSAFGFRFWRLASTC
jgi:hypothetical protein